MSGTLILASASPRRSELLQQVGLQFSVVPSDFVESESQELPPSQVALHNALGKAKDVAGRMSSCLALGADTIVVCRGQLLGKPKDRAEARRMLELLSGRWHDVFTAVALVRGADGYYLTDVVKTRVHMRVLSSQELSDYLDSGEPFGKAGAYGIQGRAARFIDRIEGCYSNVVGLPLSRTTEMLKQISNESADSDAN